MRKNVLIIIAVFVFGLIAGLNIGAAIGRGGANADLVQSNAELETRLDTVNENYVILMREYNKLFSSKAAYIGGAPVKLDPEMIVPVPETVIQEPQIPTVPEATSTVAPSSSEPTQAPQSSGDTAKPVANFEAVSINGTGPLEGPPPQAFEFSDLSTGSITSWLWDFGDGVTSTEQNPEHTIEKCPGESELCTVSLTICGPGGCDTMTKIDYLWVSESCTGC